MCSTEDCVSGFLKGSGDIALKESENLSRTREGELKNTAVDDLLSFLIRKSVHGTPDIRDKPYLIFNMDGQGLSFINVPPKTVATMGVGDFFLNKERQCRKG